MKGFLEKIKYEWKRIKKYFKNRPETALVIPIIFLLLFFWEEWLSVFLFGWKLIIMLFTISLFFVISGFRLKRNGVPLGYILTFVGILFAVSFFLLELSFSLENKAELIVFTDRRNCQIAKAVEKTIVKLRDENKLSTKIPIVDNYIIDPYFENFSLSISFIFASTTERKLEIMSRSNELMSVIKDSSLPQDSRKEANNKILGFAQDIKKNYCR